MSETPTHYVGQCQSCDPAEPVEFEFSEEGWAELQEYWMKHMYETGHGVTLTVKNEKQGGN
ncbi:hypothetical protein GCM10010423_64810 [Streptomyces levis]|uniref:Uncharacterized protein n=1 Tax=Streptomyces levis TaxID=285566 RepID=A0ABN3P0R1_9ACTN